MSNPDLNKLHLERTALISALALVMTTGGGIIQTASADILEFSFGGSVGDAWFTMLDPTGAPLNNGDATGNSMFGWRTAVAGTMKFNTTTGTGTGSMDPFSFFGGGLASTTTVTFQAIGNGSGGPGTLVLGNMGFNWGGTNGIPVSIILEAADMFGAMGGGLTTSDVITGSTLGATEDTLFGAKGTYTLPMGPGPVMTTTFDTTDFIPNITLGTNPSGTLPLTDDGLGGSPMKAGPFPLFNANFDMLKLHVDSAIDETPPDITMKVFPATGEVTPVNLDIGDLFTDPGATCADPASPANPGGTTGLSVSTSGDTVDTSVAGTYTIDYDCTDNATPPNSATQAHRVVNVTAAGTPVITLLGTDPDSFEAAPSGTSYPDPGATCAVGGVPIVPDPTTSDASTVVDPNINVPGSYTVTYNCTDSGTSAVPVTRQVDIVDTTPPVITLTPSCGTGSSAITQVADGTDPTPTGTSTDIVDGGPFPITPGGDTVDPSPDFGTDLSQTFKLVYSASDTAGNNAFTQCDINLGNPDPVATLLGPATVVVTDGADYKEDGATCEDFTDGTLADATPDMPIDGSTPDGSYTITYTCGPNTLGNSGTTTRSVVVGAPFSATATSGSTFSMLDPTGKNVGGATDVFFSWTGALYTTNDPATQPENMFMGSAEPQPFFGFPWFAHDIRAFAPGDYTITTSRGGTLKLHVDENQIGAHMLFDWSTNTDIDVVLVWDINGVFVGSPGNTSDDQGSKGQIFSLTSVDQSGANSTGLPGTPMADGPFKDFNANFNIKMTPNFGLPDASATAEQAGNDPTNFIALTGSDEVTITASVNPDVSGVFSYAGPFTYDWSDSDAALLSANSNGPDKATFEFNPDSLSEGALVAVVKATDSATSLTSTVRVPLEMVNTDASNPAVQDTDADGIPQSQDGIDNNTTPKLQQAESGNASAFLAESSAGKLVLGEAAIFAGANSGAYQMRISEDDIGVEDPDVDGSCVGGCFNFKVTDLTPGAAVDVVLPLNAPLPKGSSIRKFVNQQWRQFEETGGNAIMSAAGSAGDCPSPSGAGWSNGLTEGHLCIKLTIVDGGTNDADVLANGTIVDPVGASGASNTVGLDTPGTVKSPNTGGGCSLGDAQATASKHSEWWLLGGLLAWLGTSMRRRRNR